MSLTIHHDDPVACAAAAFALARTAAIALRTQIPEALCGRPSTGLEILARRAEEQRILDRFFRDSLHALIQEIDARIAAGTIHDFETQDGWDGEGREVTHLVPVTVRTSDAETLRRAAAPLLALLEMIDRVRDLLAAEGAIARIR